MDDPIFDPWSGEAEAPTSPTHQGPKWRSPGAAGPTIPVAPPSSSPAPTALRTGAPRARLAGTGGFLRSMAAPRLTDIAQRLALARHEAAVEDHLDAFPPVLRLTVRPWRGPLAAPDAVEGVLEIMPLGVEQDAVGLRYACEAPERPLAEEERIPTAKLTASWLEGRVLGFVGQVLDRA